MESAQVDQRYDSGFVFYDSESDFQVSFAGFQNYNNNLLSQYQDSINQCYDHIQRMESGEKVNSTKVAADSEDRPVDHYNLRSVDELVPGKSLSHSLKIWEEIKGKVEDIKNGRVLNDHKEMFTDVIFNGLGGSFLGPLMIVISQLGDNFNQYLPLKIHFVANTDPESYHSILNRVNLSKTIMCMISKSGTTAETKGNIEAWYAALRSANLDVGKHCIAVTTKDSWLDKQSIEHGYLFTAYMNITTGGRFSVSSAVGMVPCAFAGLDFSEFLKGLSHMDQLTRRTESQMNPALLISLCIHHTTLTQGHKNMIILGYSDYLKEYAHYLQQMYMESLGKDYTIDGTPRREGQTVFGGVGTGEQHAFVQQTARGIDDCFVRFMHFRHRSYDYNNEKAGSMGRQLLAFVKGTEHALINNNKSFITVTHSKRDLFNIGMAIALDERIVSFLSIFKQINAYDQPGVQDGKISADNVNKFSKEVVRILANSSFKGTAKEFIETHLPEAPLLYIDAILSDIDANLKISYKDLSFSSTSRSWNGSAFVYNFE